MKLNRSLIKSQAKELIKGNVFKLFIIIFVVILLAEGSSIISLTVNIPNYFSNDLFSSFSDSYDKDGDLYDFEDEYDFDDFDSFSNDFSDEIIGGANSRRAIGLWSGLGALSSISNIIILFLAPLAITLAGVFYQLIKGNNLSWEDEFSYVFGKTFDKNYWSKFLLALLKEIFMGLLLLLFIVPGIIFYYKYYFTSFIMAEKPELSWKEAMQISKKMTNGHKGELFVLDLSFIGWYILTSFTFGILSIYVLPYVYTTQALYYENFKIRAFQSGEMSEFDYLTENEKAAAVYQNGAAQQNNYYQPPQENTYQPPVESNFYQPQSNTYEKAENPQSTMDEPEKNEE